MMNKAGQVDGKQVNTGRYIAIWDKEKCDEVEEMGLWERAHSCWATQTGAIREGISEDEMFGLISVIRSPWDKKIESGWSREDWHAAIDTDRGQIL